ncbi:hypothetical protein ACMFMF_004980 [Clarireedia jacksonii]
MASWLAYYALHSLSCVFAAIVSWLAYHGCRSLWSVFGWSKNVQLMLNSQQESPLPRLYPIFPADGSKGDTNVDIIAVHGIETISPKTWIAYQQDTEPRGHACNWLEDDNMLPSVIKGARIWAFDYNSNYSHNAQTVWINGLATTLLNCIKDRHDDFKSRNIVFVGSCFGGIVVAEALLTASRETKDERKRAVADQTVGVIFLGSPLRGAQAATFAGWQNFISGFIGLSKESSCTLLKDLEANSSRLESLVADFGKLTVPSQTQAGIEIRCFYETRKTQLLNAINRNFPFKPMEALLVDKVSACLDCHEQIPLDVRHAMMNKYRGPEDPNFKLVAGRIKDVVDKIRSDKLWTTDDRDCIRELSFPYQDQKDVNPERAKGTCEWFLQHPKFREWRKETTANLIWVTAGPGCGKSVLSKALVDEGLLHSENPNTKTTSICYFFFKDDVVRGSGVNALRSVLHQLFRQKPWLIRYATQEYKNFGSNLPFGTLWDILIKAVADANAGPVICVFDALDECEPSSRTPLIKYISNFYRFSNTTSPKLKFIVTSRPYHEIAIEFKVDNLPSIHLEGNEMSKNIGREVDLVIDHEIVRIGNTRQLNAKTQDSLKQHLKKHNNRTYLWVYLILQEILRSLESTEQKLAQLLKIIPRTIDEAYEKILKRAINPKQAKRMLGLVLAAERPLTLKEMNIAFELLEMEDHGKKYTSERDLVLDKEKAFQKKIENLCGFFLSIVDKRIYLIHQTAKEFLIKESSSTNDWSPSCWKHTFTLYDSHLEALKVCLWYLQLDFQDGGISSPNDDQLAQDHPLLLYASINWTLHFQQARERIHKELTENALQLCNTKAQRFLLWFRIFEGHQHSELPTRNINDLIVASYFGLTPIVQLLLIGTSNVNAKSKDNMFGQTPLRKDIELEARDSQYSRTPLSWAAIRGHEAVVKLLLERGAKLEAKDRDSQTPLLWAAQRGHKAVVKLLLERGAKLEAKDRDSQTPLLWAAQRGHEAVVKLLLERGAKLEAKDCGSQTPLLWAAQRGHEAVVKLLLERGAELEAKDHYSQTPLSCAAIRGHEAVVKLLLERGAKLEAKDRYRRTPLVWAAQCGHEAVVKLLLERGAELEAKDRYS